MKRIIAVSAGQEFPKKGNTIIRKKLKYLNFGLLGLVTLIHHYSAHEIKMFQADDLSVLELIKEIEDSGINLTSECECVLLSIPSYHAISWCEKFCEYIKMQYGLKIIVGGRWVVDNHADWVRKRLRYVDFVSEGFGEHFMAEYFGLYSDSFTFDGKYNCFPYIDYTLLHNYMDYHPNIEISRGCGAGCHFCADKDNRRLKNKSVEAVMNELSRLDHVYGSYTPYYTAPHFVFDRKWVSSYYEAIQKRSSLVKWRCTTRVESVPLEMLEILHASGLKIIDVGLESASVTQLTRMHKTSDPQRYLEQASALLETCKQYDIWVKLNVMLYAGETMETVHETMDWLRLHRNCIKDVSAGSLVYYHNMDNISELMQMGASIPEDEDFENEGFATLHLSSEIDKSEAGRLCLEIPKIVADQRDFFDIKTFSYYPSSYTYEDFMKDVRQCDPNELPFRIEP